MLKIEESAIAEISDRAMLLAAQFGLIMFVIWLVAAIMGKGHLAEPKKRAQTVNHAGAGKWHAASDPNPQPFNEVAWKTAVGMTVG